MTPVRVSLLKMSILEHQRAIQQSVYNANVY